MASNHHDNEPFIVVSAFNDACLKAEARYGNLSRAKAEKIIFLVMNDTESAHFTTKLGRAKTVAGVSDSERSRYHSMAVRYFNDPRVKGNQKKGSARKKVAASPKTSDAPWDLIKALCVREQPLRAREAGEDRLSEDWGPEYEGPSEDEWT